MIYWESAAKQSPWVALLEARTRVEYNYRYCWILVTSTVRRFRCFWYIVSLSNVLWNCLEELIPKYFKIFLLFYPSVFLTYFSRNISVIIYPLFLTSYSIYTRPLKLPSFNPHGV